MALFKLWHIIIRKNDDKRGNNVNNSYTSGFLQVTVLGGDGISPIKNALVTVFSEGNIVASAHTDNSGSTMPIPIVAYNVDYNTPSENEKSVKRDRIEIEAPGYYKGVRNNVPIFPGIVTREYVYMVPTSVKDGSINSSYEGELLQSGTQGSYPGGKDSEL